MKNTKKDKELFLINLRKFFGDGISNIQCLKDYSAYISKLLAQLDYSVVKDIINCFLEAKKRSSIIFFIGNGGSAATASHFSQDLAEVGRKVGKRGFKTLSLTDRIAFITALANDYGYENVFSEQIVGFLKKGDVLVAISASGNSPNIVKAVKYAKRLGGKTIAFVGFDGGELSKICDYVLHVKTPRGHYGPVEDIHMILAHMITTYLMVNNID